MRVDRNPDEGSTMRVVGRRRDASGLSLGGSRDEVLKWRRAFPTPFVPKGVYRFESHEEADRWLWDMLTRPRDR